MEDCRGFRLIVIDNRRVEALQTVSGTSEGTTFNTLNLLIASFNS